MTMETITKKLSDGTTLTTEQDLDALLDAMEREEERTLAKGALRIRVQAILKVNQGAPAEKINELVRDFRPGQGRGSNGIKETLIAQLTAAGIILPGMEKMTSAQLTALAALIPAPIE